MKDKKNTTMLLVDVETTFGTPTPYSGYMTEFGAVEFHSGKTFHDNREALMEILEKYHQNY